MVLMKPMQPEQFKGFAKKRLPTRENSERMLAVGIMLEMQGDEFGVWLQDHAEKMLELRQAAKGGRRDVNGSPRHWDAE